MEGFDFKINSHKLDEYAIEVKDWCLSNALICISNDPQSIKFHDSCYPLPVTLLPTKFPKKQYEFAIDIQKHFNELVHNISNDFEFLNETLKDVIKVDDFTCNLWRIYENIRAEGIAQPITMNILRNDLMLDKNKENAEVMWSQIEINTVSVSFGGSTSQMRHLHKKMLSITNNEEFIPNTIDNDNVSVLAKGIVDAWKLYENAKAFVVVLVSENERNIGDQRLLEKKCYKLNSNIQIKRLTFSQIRNKAKLNETNKRLIYDDNEEIALVYFRAGYSPNDYSNHDWETRLLIERSLAIKSPNIQAHLAGSKKIQQILSEPNVLDKFLKSKEIADKLRATFVDQYSFKDDNFDEIVHFMLKNAKQFVLKPQREGGGNNIYGEDIKKFYTDLEDKNDLRGYILMRMIEPFVSQNYVIKTNKTVYEKENLISELGIFGVVISKGAELLSSETGGYLIRTKPLHVNEGGVATGYAALDSLYLV